MNTKKDISRRLFLRRAGGTAIGIAALPSIVPSSALGRDGAVAPSERIVMGCIGLGGQGTGDMHAFLANSDVQVVAVCDVDSGHRNRARDIVDGHYKSKACEAYNDFRNIVAREDIDAVLVGTPDHWHALISTMAVRSGKDVYCEKPLTHTVAEGRALCDAVQRHGRILQTGTQRRSFDACRRACELVRNGRIGKLQVVKCGVPAGYAISGGDYGANAKPEPVPEGFDYDMWLGPAPFEPYTPGRCHFNFRWLLDYSAGYITDWGAHYLDIAQWGNGTDATGPTEIAGRGEFPADGFYDAAISHHIEFSFANGVKFISFSTDDKTQWGMRFEGSEGWLYVESSAIRASSEAILREQIGADEILLDRSPGHHRNFLDAVRSRGTVTAPAETGHRSASICHLANICLLTGRTIRWDPDREQILDDPEASRLLGEPRRSPWAL